MSISHREPGIRSTASDVEILRAFEPIVRYTQGEKFFPMDVERYLRASSLWLYVPDGLDEEVISEGELTIEELVERRDAPFGSIFYLRFVGQLDLQGSARRSPASAGWRSASRASSMPASAGSPAEGCCPGSSTASSRSRCSCAARSRGQPRPPPR